MRHICHTTDRAFHFAHTAILLQLFTAYAVSDISKSYGTWGPSNWFLTKSYSAPAHWVSKCQALDNLSTTWSDFAALSTCTSVLQGFLLHCWTFWLSRMSQLTCMEHIMVNTFSNAGLSLVTSVRMRERVKKIAIKAHQWKDQISEKIFIVEYILSPNQCAYHPTNLVLDVKV